VNQTFDTLFELGKAAIVGKVGDTRLDAGTFWITVLDRDPRIFAQLFQAQRYTVALAIELENLDFDFVANIDDFAWVLDALPRHVGDVQQAIDAAEINERAVIGKVLDDTFDGHAFLQRRQQCIAFCAVGFFQHRATADNNVVTFLVEFDNFKVERFAFKVRGFAHWTYINQRPRQKRADRVDIDSEATFDLAIDDAFDDSVCFEGFFEIFPRFGALGFFARQTGFTETVFYCFQRDLYFIADFKAKLAVVVDKLAAGNNTFGFETGVDGYPIRIDINDDTGNDGTRFHIDGFQAFFKKFCKAFAHVKLPGNLTDGLTALIHTTSWYGPSINWIHDNNTGYVVVSPPLSFECVQVRPRWRARSRTRLNTSSMESTVLSSTKESAAGLSGATARWVSRSSRALMSSRSARRLSLSLPTCN